jgi:sugar O-acyltransferase (sialic acid O-acetyltransferase NeuD family)
MNDTLYIYGYGGFGREIFDIAKRTQKFEDIKFIDDNIELANGKDILTFEQVIALDQIDSMQVIIGIGDPFVRRKIIDKLMASNFVFANVICPSAIISPSAIIEKGVYICSYCIVGPGSTIGNHVVMNIQSIVGHDIVIGSNTVLSSQVNIGGGTKVGSDCYIGMSSIVKECLKIGDCSVLGMGSSLHRDLASGYLAMGNPARPLRKLEDDFKIFNKN